MPIPPSSSATTNADIDIPRRLFQLAAQARHTILLLYSRSSRLFL